MTYIENIFLCMASPLLVAALCMGRRQLRFFLFCIAGMGVCLLSAYINTFLAAVCHVAGSSPRMANVSSISHQKVGLAGEVSGQKQPTVQSRYSANAKHSTPMWKYRIFRAAPVCVFA